MEAEQNRNWIVALIAVPRTGTNFLCYLLNYHPLITFYYEIFHPAQLYIGKENNPLEIIDYINHKYSFNFLDLADPNLIQWIHNHPTKLIDILVKINPRKHIGFKLFPNHLDYSTIEAKIIRNRNTKKILVKRNLLDTYISYEIAMRTNKWGYVDTSKICLSLSIEDFATWIDWAEKWYQFFEKASFLAQEKYFVLHYEDIHKHKTNTEKLIYLSNFLNNMGLDNDQKLTMPNVDNIQVIPKQDTRENIENKITNYREFREKAQDKGLSKYLRINKILDQQ